MIDDAFADLGPPFDGYRAIRGQCREDPFVYACRHMTLDVARRTGLQADFGLWIRKAQRQRAGRCRRQPALHHPPTTPTAHTQANRQIEMMPPLARYVQHHERIVRIVVLLCLLACVLCWLYDAQSSRPAVQIGSHQHAAANRKRNGDGAVSVDVDVDRSFDEQVFVTFEHRGERRPGEGVGRRRFSGFDSLVRIGPVPQFDEAVVGHKQVVHAFDAGFRVRIIRQDDCIIGNLDGLRRFDDHHVQRRIFRIACRSKSRRRIHQCNEYDQRGRRREPRSSGPRRGVR